MKPRIILPIGILIFTIFVGIVLFTSVEENNQIATLTATPAMPAYNQDGCAPEIVQKYFRGEKAYAIGILRYNATEHIPLNGNLVTVEEGPICGQDLYTGGSCTFPETIYTGGCMMMKYPKLWNSRRLK